MNRRETTIADVAVLLGAVLFTGSWGLALVAVWWFR